MKILSAHRFQCQILIWLDTKHNFSKVYSRSFCQKGTIFKKIHFFSLNFNNLRHKNMKYWVLRWNSPLKKMAKTILNCLYIRKNEITDFSTNYIFCELLSTPFMAFELLCWQGWVPIKKATICLCILKCICIHSCNINKDITISNCLQ